MTLDELTNEENRLLAELSRVTGLMEEKSAQLKCRGVFSAYARVHAAYAELAADGDPETLKRALFLQWYAVSEPCCFTGLFDLASEAQRGVLELLDDLAAADALDGELRWMLPYYHLITDFHFDAPEGLSSLKQWLREHASDVLTEARTRDAALAGRGQMSTYWYRPVQAAERVQ